MLAAQSRDLETLPIRAEIFLRSGAEELFKYGLDEIRDGSECGLAREPVVIDPSGRLTLRRMCRKAECVCVQPAFLEGRKDEVDAAATALRSHPRFRAMGALAQKAMASKNELDRKGKNCWGAGGLGGDISIALECNPDETLLTTDASFEVIASAVDVQVERVEATPPP